MIGVLVKMGNLDTGTDTYILRMPSEERDRYQGDRSQGMLKTDSKPPEVGRAMEQILPALRRNQPC